MAESLPIEALPVHQLRAILEADGRQLDEEQVRALRRFLRRVGGLENARLAVAMLSRLEDAA